MLARASAPHHSGWLSRLRGNGQVQKRDWVGTSMGGLIGMLLAARRGSPIRRLVLNDIGPLVPWSALLRMKGYITRGKRFGDGLHGHLDREFPLGPDLLRGIDLWNVWSKVECPTLVLRGAESDVLRANTVKEMKEREPDLEVAEFPGDGHAPALMSADQIRVVKEFLLRA